MSQRIYSIEQHAGYSIALTRIKGSSLGGYYSAVATRPNCQKIHAYGPWGSCIASLRKLIDEEIALELVLRSRLIEGQLAASTAEKQLIATQPA